MRTHKHFQFIVGVVSIPLLTLTLTGPAIAESLYAVDVYDPTLWILDPADGSTIGAHRITAESGTVEGGNGLAIDPISGSMYALLKVSNWSQRSLATIDPETAIATVIADLAYSFASMTFDDSGTLYGVTGSGSFIPSESRNALFTIDPSDGSLTQVCKFASGNQGHSLSFGDGLIYYATQEGTDYYGDVLLMTVDPASFPVDPTDPCPTTDIEVTYDSGGVPVHTQSILVTSTGATTDLLLTGWHNYNSCCGTEMYEIVVDGGSGTGTLLGETDSNYKGLAFHSFEPTSFATLGDATISKFGSTLREGKLKHVIYSIDVTAGDDAISGVTLTDSLDTSKLAYLSDDSGCDLISGFQVTCDLGTIDANETTTVTIDTQIICKGKNCSEVSNTATMSLSLDQWVTGTVAGSANISTSIKGKLGPQ